MSKYTLLLIFLFFVPTNLLVAQNPDLSIILAGLNLADSASHPVYLNMFQQIIDLKIQQAKSYQKEGLNYKSEAFKYSILINYYVVIYFDLLKKADYFFQQGDICEASALRKFAEETKGEARNRFALSIICHEKAIIKYKSAKSIMQSLGLGDAYFLMER